MHKTFVYISMIIIGNLSSFYKDEDEEGDRITVRSDDELQAMIQWVRLVFKLLIGIIMYGAFVV